MNKYETKLVPMLDRSDFDLIDKNRYGINYYRLPNKLIVAMDYTDVCESLMCGGFMTYYAMGIGKTKIEALSVLHKAISREYYREQSKISAGILEKINVEVLVQT